jgi:hypothetical protein
VRAGLKINHVLMPVNLTIARSPSISCSTVRIRITARKGYPSIGRQANDASIDKRLWRFRSATLMPVRDSRRTGSSAIPVLQPSARSLHVISLRNPTLNRADTA